MQTEIILIAVALLLGFYNGQFIMNYSKLWHATGWLIRALLIIPLWPSALWIALYVVIAWPLYDIIINLHMKQKWYYQGKTSFMDRYFPPAVMWPAKLVWIIILIIEIFYLF
jgi:hypothetical protein